MVLEQEVDHSGFGAGGYGTWTVLALFAHAPFSNAATTCRLTQKEYGWASPPPPPTTAALQGPMIYCPDSSASHNPSLQTALDTQLDVQHSRDNVDNSWCSVSTSLSQCKHVVSNSFPHSLSPVVPFSAFTLSFKFLNFLLCFCVCVEFTKLCSVLL